MIAYLSGKIKFYEEDRIVLNVSGVGYEVFASRNTLDDVAAKTDVELFIYTHIREDALQLFGFATQAEKEVFTSLISVNGIGPKGALKILSGTKVSDLIRWIEQGDIGALTQLPKVGKKTAEQILFSLKDKLVLKSQTPKQKLTDGVKRDIYSALVNLGYSAADVEKTVAPMSPEIGFQEGVREGLQQLSGHN